MERLSSKYKQRLWNSIKIPTKNRPPLLQDDVNLCCRLIIWHYCLDKKS